MIRYKTQIIQYVLAFTIICLVSFLFYSLSAHIGYHIVSFVLLFVASIMAAFLRTGPILMASTLCAMIWDYFFIPPTHTFQIGTTEDTFMLGMFFLIALVNGILTSRIRSQERLTRDREERTYSLFEFTKGLSQAAGLNEVIKVAKNGIKKYFETDIVFFLQDDTGNLKTQPFNGRKLSKNDFEIASRVYTNGNKAGRFTDLYNSSEYTFFPLKGTSVKPGVVVASLKNWFTGYKELQWNTFLSQISAAIEREFLDEMAKKAQILDESDKLYKTLFNTISHELRIPVATIMAASETMQNQNHSEEVRIELSQEINKAAERLNRLIENLLNMSRLESGQISPRMDWCDVHDLINRVTDNLQSELKPFSLIVHIPEKMPPVKLDFGLMETVVNNLLYNACLYADKNTNLRIRINYEEGEFTLEVMDRGPGFPIKALPYVFNKFYRVKGSRAGGTGLGLSIVKGFVEAQKGIVTVENRQHGGARITIRIPSEIPEIENMP
jgi:two-component system sensor histidine kinase KdpD